MVMYRTFLKGTKPPLRLTGRSRFMLLLVRLRFARGAGEKVAEIGNSNQACPVMKKVRRGGFASAHRSSFTCATVFRAEG